MVTSRYFTLQAEGSQWEVIRIGDELISGKYPLTVLI